MAAFADDSIDGIVSTIGGTDSIRILPYLDLQVIRDHPKVFMGFSDTTILRMLPVSKQGWLVSMALL